ncbi:terminase [Vibrio fluvialis]|uniref:terminase n=1 Tax=Vibrio fluvialis TaxID=676 RepID=UPI00215D4607|nr:terminase [Vibrio fluvialis]MCR9299293.1 terminase [Vibrio fluvialis]
MKLNDMIEWQWSGYASFHQSRKNLMIHIVFVPMFIISFISFTRSLLGLELVSALSSLVIMALSFGLQGLGHRQEVNPAVPFTGFRNAVVRILLEQFYTFPRFVLTGKWYQALRDSDS